MTNLEAAAIRAARTFAQAFAGWLAQKWIASGELTASAIIVTVGAHADAAAGAGILAAALALGWNMGSPGPVA